MLLFKNHAWVNSVGQAEGEAGRVWKAPGRGSSARVGAASQLLDLSWQMLQQKKRSDGVALIREEEEGGPERTHKRRPLTELEPVLEKPTARIIQIQHRQSRAMTPSVSVLFPEVFTKNICFISFHLQQEQSGGLNWCVPACRTET